MPGGVGFEVSWYHNTPPTSADSIFTVGNPVGIFTSVVDSLIIDALGPPTDIHPGNFSGILTNLFNGCPDTIAHFLPFANQHLVVDIDTVPSTECFPGNGNILVNVIIPDTLSDGSPNPNFGNPHFYEFRLYDDYGTSNLKATINNFPAGPLNPDPATDGFKDVGGLDATKLPAGEYGVIVYDLINNCPSELDSVEIFKDVSDPDITLSLSKPSITCDPALPTAELAAMGSTPIPIGTSTNSNYRFKWVAGNDTSVAALQPEDMGDNKDTTIALTAGTYAVVVEDLDTKCISVADTTIIDDPAIVTLIDADIRIKDDRFCDMGGGPPALGDGEIEILDISLNGAPDPDFGLYTFELLDAAGLAYGPAVTGNPILGLDSGTYFVQGTSGTTNCQSSLVELRITDIPNNPVVLFNLDSAQTSCDIAFPSGATGKLTSMAEEFDGSTPDFYTFNWNLFPNSVPGVPTFDPLNPAMGVLADTALSAFQGNYQVLVTNETTLCIDSGVFVIPFNQTLPQLTLVNKVEDQYCTDGNALVEVLATSGSVLFPEPLTTYTYSIFDKDTVKVVQGAPPRGILTTSGNDIVLAAAMNATFTELDTGIYHLQAQRDDNGCISEILQVPIQDDSNDPVVLFTLDSAQTTCDIAFPSGATGKLTSMAEEFDGSTPDFYTFNWNLFPNPAPGVPTFDPLNPAMGVLADTALSAFQGNYQVLVTNETTLCIDSGVFVIPFNQTLPQLTLVNKVEDQYCTDGNALVEVLANSGSVLFPEPLTIYTYSIFDENLIKVVPGIPPRGILTSSGNDISIAPAMNVSFTELDTGIYHIQSQRDDNGCISESLQVTIQDNSNDPVVTFVLDSDQTSCDFTFPAGRTGQLTANATEFDGSTPDFYLFDWNPFLPPTVGSIVPANGTGGILTSTIFQAEQGNYTALVTNETTGCQTTGGFQILLKETPPIVNLISKTDDRYCITGDGEIVVIGDPGSFAAPVAPNDTYTYNFCQGPSFGAAVLQSSVNGPANPPANVTEGLLENNTYFFEVRRNDNGCVSQPLSVEIIDISMDPVVAFSNILPQTSCDAASPVGLTGELLATADEADNSIDTYTFNFVSTPGSFTQNVVANTSGITQGSSGNYTLDVSNTVTGCIASGTEVIPEDLDIPSINLISIVQDRFCVGGNASIEVIGSPGGPGYTYQWYKDTINVANILAPTGSLISGLDTGTYQVTARRSDNFCRSLPLTADIQDISKVPVITLSDIFAQSSCDLTSPAGPSAAVLATVNESNGIIDDYAFVWNTPGPLFNVTNTSNTSNITNAETGDYVVSVTNNNTGCIDSARVNLPEDFPEILILDGGLLLVDQTSCVPPNGSAQVINATQDGVPINLSAGYTVDWTDSTNMNLLFTGNPNSQMIAGDYHSIVRNSNTGCVSLPRAFSIQNFTLPNEVAFTETIQTSCDPNNPNGALSATADGGIDDTNPDYVFIWFAGTDTVGTSIGGGSTIGMLNNGPYTVQVVKVSTGCKIQDTNVLGENVMLPRVLASNIPLTTCSADNGELFAAVIDPDPGTVYDYMWYAGNQVKPVPDYTGAQVFGLTAGVYTVVATETAINFCVSEPIMTELPDERELPTVIILEDKPVNNCDPLRPDGQLSATNGEGQVVGFAFNWYLGPPPPMDTIIVTGSILKDAAANTYTVHIINDLTGCSATASRTVTEDLPTIPVPDIGILAHLTKCDIDDGKLEASVGGTAINHLFNWYFGPWVSPNPDFMGHILDQLGLGTYTVTATDIQTGCVSDPASEDILDLREFPEFEIITTAANCEQLNGTATLETTQKLGYSEILWGNGAFGPYNTGLDAGTYTIMVTASNNCVKEESFEVPIDIFNFNGISKNGDGMNEWFEIACISDFPNNNVKVFNRNGSLVYEADGYDNVQVFFDGIANRGLDVIGTDVPDGTYFYIIDKGDGSKPVSGFLELLR